MIISDSEWTDTLHAIHAIRDMDIMMKTRDSNGAYLSADYLDMHPQQAVKYVVSILTRKIEELQTRLTVCEMSNG